MMWIARWKPAAAVAAALIVAAAGVAVHGRQEPPANARKITVTAVRSKAVTLTQQYVGQIKSHHHIEIRAPVAGNLGEVQVGEGQAVKRGDLLFRITPLDREKPDAEGKDNAASIKAPFDGVLGRLRRQQGSFVREGRDSDDLVR